jgi:hypothetical protein
LVVAEDVVRKLLRARKQRIPRPLLIACTTLVLLGSAYLFWYPPIEHHTDVALRVMQAINGGSMSALAGLRELVARLGLHGVAQAAAAVTGSASA